MAIWIINLYSLVSFVSSFICITEAVDSGQKCPNAAQSLFSGPAVQYQFNSGKRKKQLPPLSNDGIMMGSLVGRSKLSNDGASSAVIVLHLFLQLRHFVMTFSLCWPLTMANHDDHWPDTKVTQQRVTLGRIYKSGSRMTSKFFEKCFNWRWCLQSSAPLPSSWWSDRPPKEEEWPQVVNFLHLLLLVTV